MLLAPSSPQPEQVAAFFQKHRTGLVALVFTDLVDSTALLNQLGDQAGASFLRRRREIIRDTLRTLPEAEEIETAGDSFLLAFAKPSDAVRFALQSQARLRQFSTDSNLPVQERMGIHLGEVVISEHETETKAKDLYGIQLATCARVMSLAQGGQILLTRGVFDSARQVLKGEDLPGVGALSWVSHGPYLLKGIEEAVEVCEVGEALQSPPSVPKTSDKAQRQVRPDEEPVLGWRPAVGQEVPSTKWVLEEKLGEGGFGEVWRARHEKLKEFRVFKFCFRADRVRSLKREVTLFRLLKERIGEHPNIVKLHDIYFDQPPFYLEEEYVAGKDLKTWCEAQGGIDKVPLEVRLEIVAQAAEALQAAHDAGIIHRDVKPGNILISQIGERRSQTGSGGAESGARSPESAIRTPGSELRAPTVAVKLTDFGIGQVISAEYLKGVTQAGFTQTMVGSTSSGTGTTMYLAPEIIAGHPATTRSDIYSLGAVLYQLVEGDFRLPVTGDWAERVEDSLLRDDLRRCLAGKQAERFADVIQLAQTLRGLATRRTELVRRQDELRALQEVAYRRGVLRTASVSALIGALLLALAFAAIWQSRRAMAEKELARQEAYAADMRLVQENWRAHNLAQAGRLLERHRPQGKERDRRQWEWRYWWSRCRSDSLYVVRDNLEPVPSIAISADGKQLAIHQWDRIALLDLEARRETAQLPRNSGANRALAFSPDEATLAYGTQDPSGGHAIVLWDARRQAVSGYLTNAVGPAQVEFSADAHYLAALSGDSCVRLWDLKTLSQVATIPVSGSHIHKAAVCFSPDGRYLAVGELDGRVRLVDWRSGKEQWQTSLPTTEGVTAIAFSPNGEQLACGQGYSETRAFLLAVRSGELRRALAGHTGWICALVFAKSGDRLFSASADQTIGVWDLVSGKQIRSLRGHTGEVWSLRLSADGRRLYSGGKEGSVRAWDPAVPLPPAAHRVVPEAVLTTGEFSHCSLAFCRDGALLTITRQGNIAEWDSQALAVKGVLDALGTNNTSVALCSDDRWLAIGKRSGDIQIWDRQSTRLEVEFRASAGPVLECHYDHKSQTLVVEILKEDRTWAVAEWRVPDGHREATNLRLPGVGKIAVSPDGRHLAYGALGSPNSIQLWDRHKNRIAMEVVAHRFSVDALAFSPDGQLLISGSRDGSVKVWNVPHRRLVTALEGHLLGAHSVAFSPSGERLVTGSVGLEAMKLWDVATFREVSTLEGQAPLGLTRFSPDGNTLLGASHDGALYVWRAPSFAEIDAAEKAQAGAAR